MGMTVKRLLVRTVVSMKMMFEWVMIMMVMMVVMMAVMIKVLVFATMLMVMMWKIMIMIMIMVMMLVAMMGMMSITVVVGVMVIMVENLMYQLFLEVNPFRFKTWEENITQQSQRRSEDIQDSGGLGPLAWFL